jgi:hypothetical protein
MRESINEYSWERRDKVDISKNRVIRTTYIKVIRPKNNRSNIFKSLIIGLKCLVSFIANIMTIRNLN